ncbi:MAG TPA: RDD family protein, partial [Nitrospirota bacterium]
MENIGRDGTAGGAADEVMQPVTGETVRTGGEGAGTEGAPSGAEKTGREAPGIDARAKAGVLERSVARFIDLLLALLLAKLPGYVGFFAGLTYIGVADGLMDGRSIGKRIIKLRVVYPADNRPADLRASILRNSTIALCYMFFKVPVVGWILAAAGLLFELVLII